MKLFIILILPAFIISEKMLFAQPDTLWTKTFGGSGHEFGGSVQQTFDNGYILAGSTESFGSGGRDIWIIKTNTLGDTLWTRTFGGPGLDGVGNIQQIADGGYILTGSKDNGPEKQQDILVIKTDSIGHLVWSKVYGGSRNEEGSFIQKTHDGGYIIVGMIRGPAIGERNIWLIKTDSLGNLIWSKEMDKSFEDNARFVQQTFDLGFVILGSTGVYYYRDFWLVKTNELGDTLWTKTYGGNFDDEGYSAVQTSDSGFILTGYTESFGNGYYDIWVIKTNPLGDTLWTKTFGGPDFDQGYCIKETIEGGYIISGDTYSFGNGMNDTWLIKIDYLGNIEWTKTIGGPLWDWGGNCIQQTSDGGYIVFGYTETVFGDCDFYLIRTDSDPILAFRGNRVNLINNNTLYQNYPNPFNPTTTIKFDLPKTVDITLKIFNILGEEVSVLISDRLSRGSYSYEWDASNYASGVYLYRLESQGFVQTRKMILLK